MAAGDQAKNADFTLDWYKELSWKSNPFDPMLLKPVEGLIAGREEERKKLNLFVINRHAFGSISGEKGVGKTMLLHWLRVQLVRHEDKVAPDYINAKTVQTARDLLRNILEPTLNLYEKTISKLYFSMSAKNLKPYLMQKLANRHQARDRLLNMYDSIFSKPYTELNTENIVYACAFLRSKLTKTKMLILLIDDVENLSEKNLDLLKKLYAAKVPLQLVVAGTPEGVLRVQKALPELSDFLGIDLSSMNVAEVTMMIQKRISHVGGVGLFPFDDEIIAEMHQSAKGNPRLFLELSYDHSVKMSLAVVGARQEEQEKLRMERDKMMAERRAAYELRKQKAREAAYLGVSIEELPETNVSLEEVGDVEVKHKAPTATVSHSTEKVEVAPRVKRRHEPAVAPKEKGSKKKEDVEDLDEMSKRLFEGS